MSVDVTRTLKKIIMDTKGLTEDQANEKMSKMTQSGNLVYDVWS